MCEEKRTRVGTALQEYGQAVELSKWYEQMLRLHDAVLLPVLLPLGGFPAVQPAPRTFTLLLFSVGMLLSCWGFLGDRRMRQHWECYASRARELEDDLGMELLRRSHDTVVSRRRVSHFAFYGLRWAVFGSLWQES